MKGYLGILRDVKGHYLPLEEYWSQVHSSLNIP